MATPLPRWLANPYPATPYHAIPLPPYVANTIQSSGSLASALNKVMPKADDAPEYAIVRRGRNRNAEVKTQDAAKTPMTMCGCTGLKTRFLWKWSFEKNTFKVFLDTNRLERVYSGGNLQSELNSEHLHRHCIFP